MSEQLPRTCALCRHCTIDIGCDGYSAYTPGSSGYVDCAKGRHPALNDEGSVDLVRLRTVAKGCPDFELMEVAE